MSRAHNAFAEKEEINALKTPLTRNDNNNTGKGNVLPKSKIRKDNSERKKMIERNRKDAEARKKYPARGMRSKVQRGAAHIQPERLKRERRLRRTTLKATQQWVGD